MTLSHTPGVIKRFRRIQWKFQQTFQTPLKNLAPFVSIIISAVHPMERGTVTIDNVIPFSSRHLLPLLEKHGMPSPFYERDWSIQASDRPEVESLLHAALGDWLDFIFIPNPAPFSIYADHDEYITFFAHTKAKLDRVVDPLTRARFDPCDYHRNL
jgi:hypothetical protein